MELVDFFIFCTQIYQAGFERMKWRMTSDGQYDVSSCYCLLFFFVYILVHEVVPFIT